jgi:hypothetical protein
MSDIEGMLDKLYSSGFEGDMEFFRNVYEDTIDGEPDPLSDVFSISIETSVDSSTDTHIGMGRRDLVVSLSKEDSAHIHSDSYRECYRVPFFEDRDLTRKVLLEIKKRELDSDTASGAFHF